MVTNTEQINQLPADARPISFFEHKRDNVPKPVVLSLEQLKQWPPLVAPPAEWDSKQQKWNKPPGLALWSPATYLPGVTRGNANVHAAYLFALDLDSGPLNGVTIGDEATAKLIASLSQGPRVCLQTTYNHTPQLPRYRVTWCLSRPVNAEEYQRLWFLAQGWIVGILGPDFKKALDPQTKDPHRPYYVPAVPNAEALAWYRSELLGSGELNVDGWLAEPAAPATPHASLVTAAEFEALRAAKMAAPSKGLRLPLGADPSEWFAHICQTHTPAVHGDSGHSTLLSLANYGVVGLELAPDEAAEIAWAHYNDRCDPPWEDHERRDFDRKFTEAKPRGDALPGYLLTQTYAQNDNANSAVAAAAVSSDDEDDALWNELVAGPTIEARPEAIVDGLDLYDGCTTGIAGLPHTGKTPTSMLLAFCIANGQDWLGRTTRRRPVIYLNFEKGAAAIRKRARIASGLGLDPMSVHLVNASDKGLMLNNRAGAIEKITRLVKRLRKTAGETPFIFVDTLANSVTGLSHNENEYLDPLRDMVSAVRQLAPCPVAVLMHCKKSLLENEPPKQGDVEGSVQIVAYCDAVIGLYKPHADKPSVIRMVPVRSDREDREPITFEWHGDQEAPLTCTAIDNDDRQSAQRGDRKRTQSQRDSEALAKLSRTVESSPDDMTWDIDQLKTAAGCNSNERPVLDAFNFARKTLLEGNKIADVKSGRKQGYRKVSVREVIAHREDLQRSAARVTRNEAMIHEWKDDTAAGPPRLPIALPGRPPSPFAGGFEPPTQA